MTSLDHETGERGEINEKAKFGEEIISQMSKVTWNSLGREKNITTAYKAYECSEDSEKTDRISKHEAKMKDYIGKYSLVQ